MCLIFLNQVHIFLILLAKVTLAQTSIELIVMKQMSLVLSKVPLTNIISKNLTTKDTNSDLFLVKNR